MSFQSIAIYISLTILIILLIIIAINMNNAKNSMKWPPLVGECPDYWFDAGENGSKCTVNVNDTNLGSATSPMNFNVSPYSGARGNCSKYRWAISKGVSWDGITYGVENPCITKTSVTVK